MLFRPTRIVRVTTEQELNSALASADQVIVEGDDKLLSYAAAKALRDPDNHVAFELGKRTVSVSAGPTNPAATAMPRATADAFATSPAAAPQATPGAGRSKVPPGVMIAIVSTLAVAVAAFLWFRDAGAASLCHNANALDRRSAGPRSKAVHARTLCRSACALGRRSAAQRSGAGTLRRSESRVPGRQ